MPYKIAIQQRSGHWFAFPPELEDEMRRILQRDIALLAFMIAADVGWTGMVVERGGYTLAIYESEQHIVDTRGWTRERMDAARG